jgi:hypothetical protein
MPISDAHCMTISIPDSGAFWRLLADPVRRRIFFYMKTYSYQIFCPSTVPPLSGLGVRSMERI